MAHALHLQVLENTSNADPATLTFSNEPRGGEQDANALKGNTLGDLGIAHGHLLYVNYKEKAAKSDSVGPSSIQSNGVVSTANGSVAGLSSGQTSKAPSAAVAQRPWETAKEDPVDIYWESKDGMIARPKDARFCRHGYKAMCDHCMPLEVSVRRFKMC